MLYLCFMAGRHPSMIKNKELREFVENFLSVKEKYDAAEVVRYNGKHTRELNEIYDNEIDCYYERLTKLQDEFKKLVKKLKVTDNMFKRYPVLGDIFDCV